MPWKHLITLTSWWPRWRLKSPASRLFTQSLIRAHIKENIKAPRHWPLCGEFTGTGEFPAQSASNAENVSIWWRHHVSMSIINEVNTGSGSELCITWINYGKEAWRNITSLGHNGLSANKWPTAANITRSTKQYSPFNRASFSMYAHYFLGDQKQWKQTVALQYTFLK